MVLRTFDYTPPLSEPWYQAPLQELEEKLNTHFRDGLSEAEVELRLKNYGENKLPRGKKDSWIKIFFRQFQSPLIYLLLLASAIVFLLGEGTDALVILFVLAFNALVGAIQEGRAENTLEALNKFNAVNVVVVRQGGKEVIIPEERLVPGDLVVLDEGQRVPADLRLLETYDLRLDEAALTGESLPVHKDAQKIISEELPLAERVNSVFKGTYIVGGHGRGLVVATGKETELGKISQAVARIDTEIPLKVQIRSLSRFIMLVTLGISVVIFILGIQAGQSAGVMFRTIVSLAVSIIPEGLPVVLTLVLTLGVWRMAKRQAMVKRLQAVEALGQAEVIAVDKTGTLTRNELVVRQIYAGGRHYELGGEGYEPQGEIKLRNEAIDPLNHADLLFSGKIATLTSTAHLAFVKEGENGFWKVGGDPTEAAMMVAGSKIGFHKADLEREGSRIGEIPFDYKKRYHALAYRFGDKIFIGLSGAPEAVLSKTKYILSAGGGKEELRKEDHQKIDEVVQSMSEEGLRVIALAYRELPFTDQEILSEEDLTGLVFVGLYGMEDSARAEAYQAIERAHEAGMKVVMITGDHKVTAAAIAGKVGILPSSAKSPEERGVFVLTGEELDLLSDSELKLRLSDILVFARVAPEHKLRIIRAYQSNGQVIAMTGDGVNDAPSLVAANLGVAMGKIGTEVAKEAADIVLLDDNFGTIISASEEGRSIYRTIKKVILYLFSTSLGEVLTIGGAIVMGMKYIPLLPSQIIWLNFVTDGFLTVALGMEPNEKNGLEGRFTTKHLVDRLMIVRILFMAIPMTLGTLFIFLESIAWGEEKAWAITLTTLAAFQWLNAWNCRSERESVFSYERGANPYLIGATVIVVLLQILALYTPFLQKILHLTPLSFGEWLIALALASTIIMTEEVRKFVARRIKRD